MRSRRAAVAALLISSACARLPSIESGECGNGVVEEPEDCDGFPSENGTDCRDPGSVGECHLDCTLNADGSRPECPAGWGCDTAGICRRPTGVFERKPELEVGSATSLLAGDFDGDQHTDLASLEPIQASGVTRIRFHYFDERAELTDTRDFPLRVGVPVASDLSDDRLSDILFSDGRIGLLRGRRDRNWVPDTFSSYRIDGSGIRITSVFDGDVETTSGFVVFIRYNGVDGMYYADPARLGVPRLLSASDPVEQFVGEPASGRIFEDRNLHPCSQVVVASREQTRFWLYDACTKPAGRNDPVWRAEAEQYAIELDPPQPIDGGPQVADLNGDGHLDVLLSAGKRTYAAYGDGQALATAVPFVATNAQLLIGVDMSVPVPEIPLPLVAGDVTGDGAPDFVFPDGVMISRPAASGGGVEYFPRAVRDDGYWTRAVVADLNRDGKLDIAASSATHPGVDFFNGTGTPYLTEFSIPTSRPVEHLIAGDFDGDQINDLALSELSASTGLADSLFIAFGGVSGPPQAANAVAQVGNIQQVAAWRQGAIDHIGVCSQQEQRAGLALLESNGARMPLAGYDLTSFAADGRTFASNAVRITTGSFVQSGHGDVLAFAFGPNGDGTNLDLDILEAWLLPGLASAGTPTRLSVTFDPELMPIWTQLDNLVSLSVTSGDLDRDERDDVALAMPRGEDRCSVSTFGVGEAQLEARSSLDVGEVCRNVVLSSDDADGDGALDLLLLTGDGEDTAGTLSVFWNDGSGHFDAERRSLLSDARPRAFALLKPTTKRPLSVAFVNSEGLFLIPARQQLREFDEPQLEVARAGCTGVVAADVNGDAAVDLAYAADGNLFILQSGLESK